MDRGVVRSPRCTRKLQDRFDLARENQRVVDDGVVEGLLPDAVPNQQQPVASTIEDGDREHSPQTVYDSFSPRDVTFDDDFSI